MGIGASFRPHPTPSGDGETKITFEPVEIDAGETQYPMKSLVKLTHEVEKYLHELFSGPTLVLG